MPGTIPPTSQLDWLISITASAVLSSSRAVSHRLKSFAGGMGYSVGFVAATMVPFPRRSPHSVSSVGAAALERRQVFDIDMDEAGWRSGLEDRGRRLFRGETSGQPCRLRQR